jgi:hypothetical protein
VNFCILLDLPVPEVVPWLRPLADSRWQYFWICGGHCGRGAGFSPSTWVLLCQYHSVCASYSSSYMYTIPLAEGRAGEGREHNIQQKNTVAYFLILTRMTRGHSAHSSEQHNFVSCPPFVCLLHFSPSRFVSAVSFSTSAAPPSADCASVFILRST